MPISIFGESQLAACAQNLGYRPQFGVRCVGVMSSLVAALNMLSLPAFADSASEVLAAKLKSRYPTMTVGAVTKSTVGGLYEIVIGRDVAYTDSEGRYFFFGPLVDMERHENLSAARKEELSRVDVNVLTPADAIMRVKGGGRRKLYVFSDPDCPYCRQLEAQLDRLDDVTIYTFLYPIASLHADAGRKAEAIWCEGSDSARADRWTRVVGKGEQIASHTCDNPLKRNLALGNSLGIQGTPTLITADGHLRAGLAESSAIEKWLATAH